MTNRDEFDDHEGFQSAFGKIADAMEHGRSGLRRRGPLLGILTAAVALFVLFAVFWSTYPRGDVERAGAGPTPLIRADATPFKTAPDDPGGMDIPYRDSTVFETLRSASNNGDTKVESLLPSPEEPIARDQMFAGLKTEPLAESVPEEMAAEKVDGEKTAGDVAAVADPVSDKIAAASGLGEPPVAEESKAEVVTPEAVKPETVKAEPVKTEPVIAKADDAQKAAKTEPAAGNEKDRSSKDGTHYIQLGSVKDRTKAEGEWTKLKKEFPAELSDLSLRIQDVTLPDRGTFYRIQGGAVAQGKAKEICAAIAAKRSGGCIVVAR